MKTKLFNEIKTYARSRTSKGFVSALGDAKREWKIARLSRSEHKKLDTFLRLREKKLNLGCGPNPKPGWINVDLFDSHADLRLDLREKWPFADASIQRVYSEHVFEHFEILSEAPNFLRESVRVLRSGGRFDIGVPDTEWPLRAYGDSSNYYWQFSKNIHPEWCETQLEHINYHFRQIAQHKYAWDYETLARVLRRFGLTQIERREFDPILDSESRKNGTLYVKAIKL